MKQEENTNCIYCGKKLAQQKMYAYIHTRNVGVCCDECKKKTEEYIKLDKKYKTLMYFLIFIGGLGFMISAVFLKGKHSMIAAYLGELIAGFAFLLFPYPIVSVETFYSVPVKKIIRITKIIGIIFIAFGIFFTISLFI